MKSTYRILTIALLAVACMPAEEPSLTTAKGIYMDSGQTGKPGIKFNVMLVRDGEKSQVPSTYRFRDGDQLVFQMETNRESYVYVLNRTIFGNPANLAEYAAKGIKIEQPADAEKPKMSRYRLLFPTPDSGRENRLKANKRVTVPTGKIPFQMDSEPGIEKLYVVVSQDPIDLSKHFDMESGAARRGSSRDDKPTNDTDEDINARLKGWSDNAKVAFAEEKGIGMGNSQSYGIVVDHAKPMVVEVSLKHYSR
jgi:hypothetical protein